MSRLLEFAIRVAGSLVLVWALSKWVERQATMKWSCSTDTECEALAQLVELHRGLEGQK